jgi:hypothetical protein
MSLIRIVGFVSRGEANNELDKCFVVLGFGLFRRYMLYAASHSYRIYTVTIKKGLLYRYTAPDGKKFTGVVRKVRKMPSGAVRAYFRGYEQSFLVSKRGEWEIVGKRELR